MVDDPSALPDLFPTEKAQEKERKRLFKIMEQLVQWENTTNEEVLEKARNEIWQSWLRACSENADHPNAGELFDRKKLPAFHDPFAGGGALPLEAQRLGLESYASDLNPVAVVINKAMIEIPPKFVGKPPINPESRKNKELFQQKWNGAQGLADDIRFYGKWMHNQAESHIGCMYPKIEVTAAMVQVRSDLNKYVGQQLTVIAWLWVRTVKSPNPAYAHIDVPLASTFMLSTKPGKESYVEPVIEENGYKFSVKVGTPKNVEKAKIGTKRDRANFVCLMSGAPIPGSYIKREGKAGRIGTRLMAIVAAGDRGRVYLPPVDEHENIAGKFKPVWKPEVTISGSTQYLGVKPYGLDRFDQIFTNRQIVALTTFSDLVQEVRKQIISDAIAAGLSDDGKFLRDNGNGVAAYADAIGVYLALAVSKATDMCNSLCAWGPTDWRVRHLFSRQAIPMVWDFAETSPINDSAGAVYFGIEYLTKALQHFNPSTNGHAYQGNATRQSISEGKVISTDPPYYDNVPYADLSDFFYIWLRRSLKIVYPDLFATVAVPKTEELVAFAHRHDGKAGAEAFFLDGMTAAMHRLAKQAHPAFPVTIYYAFKQSENDEAKGSASTGWETFLEAVILAGFGVSGTWPMRTELANRTRGKESNALASSIILVCRKRETEASTISRRDFIALLKSELPLAINHLQRGNIAPVDLAQAAIGPGMSVFTRYSKVLDNEGKPLNVRAALILINKILDETLADQESDFDADSQWALTWFEQLGFSEGEYGVAEQLSKSKNTSVQSMSGKEGILESKRGKVRLLRPEELPENWDPSNEKKITNWETIHHLIRLLNKGGETAAAELLSKLGSKAEIVKELCYRLYTICERKKRTSEALAYNGLVQSWPEIVRISAEIKNNVVEQGTLFNKR